jgi:ribulose-5-phosphate 4-epimerase/fuculose-1-phosphate aldolase
VTEAGETLKQLQAAGREMVAQGLTWGNAGNLSARVEGERFLVTASGTRLGNLNDDDFVLYPASAGALHRPSKEVPMHRAVYEARPEVNAVLHGAPLYSTLLACSDLGLPRDLFPEAMYYLERTARAPYFHPGSEALGEAVREGARSANVLLLENHGVLVFDESVAEALMALQALEFACRLAVTAKGAGLALKGLPEATVQDFLQNAGYRPRRRWPA